MITGALFYRTIDHLSFTVPGLLFAMIFVTYTRLSLSEVKIKKMHIWLIAVQITLSTAVYMAVKQWDTVTAESVMICILAPTAASAAVVTAMLGGNLPLLASYTLFGNFAIALLVPILFPLLGIKDDLPFLQSFFFILKQVFPLLILPFLISLLMSKITPRLHAVIRNRQSISFYLWAVSLTIVTARTVRFLVEHGGENTTGLIIISAGALIICVFQFLFGRFIGRHTGDVISGGQALGQKNTVLAIWMAQSYMHPLASLGPASYILWQNSINTWQLWRYRRKHKEQEY